MASFDAHRKAGVFLFGTSPFSMRLAHGRASGSAMMNQELLEEILSCPNLPSLPAVALRVIELTNDSNVKLDELANTIQNDQGLSAKILRTVNSSFYGLRQRCATINKALVMLGLSPVKTLALGFSLVSSLRDDKDKEFDFPSYWRRGLYTAVAAKTVAEAAKIKQGDEAFLAGLLQDVGMVAMYRAMPARYLEVLRSAGGNHRQLVKHELGIFELQHPDIGAMLAQRWKFPDELILPVKYHERPSAGPNQCSAIIRLVGLGNIAHDIFTEADPSPAMRRFYERAQQWFNLDSETCDKLIKRIGEHTKEVSGLFKLDLGAQPSAEDLLSKASGQLHELSKLPADHTPPKGMDSLVVDAQQLDPLTGLLGRLAFEPMVRAAIDAAVVANESVGLLEISIDGMKSLAESRTEAAADEIIIGTASLLKKHFEPCGGAVCRIGANLFAVVLSGVSARETTKTADALQLEFASSIPVWVKDAKPEAFKLDFGNARHETSAGPAPTPQQLVLAATRELAKVRGQSAAEAQVRKQAA
jgi:two-component system, cell cycle response regulator